MPHANPPTLSVVTPAYQMQDFLEEFHRRMSASAQQLTPDYEIIFVNDGSTDRTLERLLAIQRADPRVVVVDLSRNFGQHQAIRTGLAQARGELVFTIDDDLEEKPEWLGEFHAAMQRDHADIVFGAQKNRKGSWFERASGEAFFFFVRTLLKQDVIPNVITARLMTRRVVDALLQTRERDIPYCRMCYQVGFVRSILYLEKSSRKSSYTLVNKLAFMCGYVASYSTRPLYWMLALGVLATGGAALGLLAAANNREAMWPFIVLNTGVVLLALGVQNIYLGKIVQEIQHAPVSVIRRIYRSD